MNVEFTEEELNILLQGLYLLEDQSWFIGKDKINLLIENLNELIERQSAISSTLCDI